MNPVGTRSAWLSVPDSPQATAHSIESTTRADREGILGVRASTENVLSDVARAASVQVPTCSAVPAGKASTQVVPVSSAGVRSPPSGVASLKKASNSSLASR